MVVFHPVLNPTNQGPFFIAQMVILQQLKSTPKQKTLTFQNKSPSGSSLATQTELTIRQ